MKDRKFIPCDCYDHGIVLFEDNDLRGRLLYLCIFQWGFDGDQRPSWWSRLKMMWRIWRHGNPYGDQVLLNKKTLPELHSALGEVIEEWVDEDCKKGEELFEAMDRLNESD
jgi:hypothetical protein